MAHKNIQVLSPYYDVDKCLAAIKECLEVGWTGLGFKTIEFEDAWKEYTKLPNAHFLNSATAGLHLAVKILKDYYGWKDGDEIISTPFTFVSTNHVILYENLVPRLADVDQDLCLDPESVSKLINNKTRAVIFVGVGGNVGQLKKIKELCDIHGLKLILDAAHMSGTKWLDGTHVGKEADVSVFSFHAVKNLPTADGGMICFMNPEFDKKARELSWLGINKDTYQRMESKEQYKWEYNVDEVGFKYHGNSIMAAIGLVELETLDYFNTYRRILCGIYDRYLIKDGRVTTISHSNCHSSRHLYQILVLDRNKLIEDLNKNNIYPGVHYISNTRYPMYKNNNCPEAEYYSDHILSLPLHVKLSFKDIYRVAETVLDCL